MDPQQTLRDMLEAILAKDLDAAVEAANAINHWTRLGGYDPDYSKAVWELFDNLVEENE